MARTGPVVRAGTGVCARRGSVMVTAVTATAAVLLAGCGTRTANPPARGGTTPAAVARARPGAGPGPAAGSRAGAQALASRLLSRLVLPPGRGCGRRRAGSDQPAFAVVTIQARIRASSRQAS